MSREAAGTDPERGDIVEEELHPIKPSDLSDHDLLVRIDGKMESACITLGHHDQDLNGNGKPGLKQDMVKAQTELRAIIRVGSIIVTSVIGLIVLTIWNAIQAAGKQ